MTDDTEAPERIAVIGCGVMGAGIATVFATAGFRVAVSDARHETAAALAARVDGVTAVVDIHEAVHDADLVIESVVEDAEVKRDVLERITRSSSRGIVATNTSSIRPSDLAAGVAAPERFLAAHFFNPPPLVPLVEVVPTASTSAAVVADTIRILDRAGLKPVRLKREVAGFVANRLQAAMLREAAHLVESDVVSYEALDAIVTSGLGPRWAAAGPFTVADLGGLDVWVAVCTRLFPELSDARSAPSALLAALEAGELGQKTGHGLFPWDEARAAAIWARLASIVGADPDPSSRSARS